MPFSSARLRPESLVLPVTRRRRIVHVLEQVAACRFLAEPAKGHRYEADRDSALVADPHDEAAVLHGLDPLNARMRPVKLWLRLRGALHAFLGPIRFGREGMFARGCFGFAMPVDSWRHRRVAA